MKGRHLTEAEIQDCALETEGALHEEHLSSCALCNMKVANYRAIFATIDELPQPALDFDATELVLSRLPHQARIPRDQSERWIYIAACFVLALLFVPLYLFRDELTKIARGMHPVALGLIGLTALVILLFQIADIHRKYLKKMNALISGELQL